MLAGYRWLFWAKFNDSLGDQWHVSILWIDIPIHELGTFVDDDEEYSATFVAVGGETTSHWRRRKKRYSELYGRRAIKKKKLALRQIHRLHQSSGNIAGAFSACWVWRSAWSKTVQDIGAEEPCESWNLEYNTPQQARMKHLIESAILLRSVFEVTTQWNTVFAGFGNECSICAIFCELNILFEADLLQPSEAYDQYCECGSWKHESTDQNESSNRFDIDRLPTRISTDLCESLWWIQPVARHFAVWLRWIDAPDHVM